VSPRFIGVEVSERKAWMRLSHIVKAICFGRGRMKRHAYAKSQRAMAAVGVDAQGPELRLSGPVTPRQGA